MSVFRALQKVIMNKRLRMCLTYTVVMLCALPSVLSAQSKPAAVEGMWAEHIQPWIALHAQSAKGKGGPMASIKGLDAMLDDYRTGASISAQDAAYNRRLKRLILSGTFDIRELSRVAMGKHWADITTVQQDRMVELMKSLLEEKAILSKEQGKQKAGSNDVYELKYHSEKYLNAEKTTALVKTSVRVPSYNVTVTLSYKLRRLRDVWKIYDVIVDDSSLVENYAYQFDAITTKHGFPELLARMEKKLLELRGGDARPGGADA